MERGNRKYGLLYEPSYCEICGAEGRLTTFYFLTEEKEVCDLCREEACMRDDYLGAE